GFPSSKRITRRRLARTSRATGRSSTTSFTHGNGGALDNQSVLRVVPTIAAPSLSLCRVSMEMRSAMSNPTNGPLTGLTVIEMGSLIAGPFCAQLLGDFGAEVIKVEDPAVGDPMRQWGRERPHGLSLWWPVLGRNKKSVTC